MRELIEEGGKNEAVTYAVVWRARPGAAAELQRMLPEVTRAAARYPGHLSVHVVTPPLGGEPIFRVVTQFDSERNFQAWRDSPECLSWVARAQKLALTEPDIQVQSGLEAWFKDPTSKQSAPATYKTAILMWAVLFPLTLLLRWLFSLLSVPFSPLIQTGMLMAIEIALVSYWIMPQMARLLRAWLYPRNGTHT